jgi:hypothetical protein
VPSPFDKHHTLLILIIQMTLEVYSDLTPIAQFVTRGDPNDYAT